ncbi:Galactosylgalactosylxylosylprotein 3-beta-glucuronosyltransferase [Echinococcus granulosus]|uniref:Galactosylgalactosylxylosylprotein 3-beta-glucuronosyltransferase n=1 Tax=Echinococcus granulosus TaxID=6210 RepID=W6UQ25_ECHGR|nr:Galactosylgalactosylxylosylprotein 3-beta-glucuronosyltransferase [Echinococcus granulosus]EUB63338.1 Galactosylgalactosylxylosylprotein 3-beta-glucuronosyltransferase [Echinococcus granulosus]
MVSLRNSSDSPVPTIYILTATHYRLVQFAELTRMCQTLLHIKNVHWVVIEDAAAPSARLENFLNRCGVSFTLLATKTPSEQVLPPGQPRWRYARGVVQRNRGLQWLRENFKLGQNEGVVYMADDDNTYSLRLFDEIRTTKRASTWPVAFVGRLIWEGCVTKPGHPDIIYRMQTIFKPWREFPIDMAGFAVNLQLILSHPDAKFVADPKLYGMLETDFLKKLGLRNFTDLEPKADGCKRILVWHTQTKDPDIVALDNMKTGFQPTMLPGEFFEMTIPPAIMVIYSQLNPCGT